MQDNVFLHKTEAVMAYFKEIGLEERILNWPEYSPDLNPIENAWGTMKKHLDRITDEEGFASTRSQLEKRIHKVWNALSKDLFVNLFNSMPKRMKLCIEADGDVIKY